MENLTPWKQEDYPVGECFRNSWKWAKNHDDGLTFVVHGKAKTVHGTEIYHHRILVANEIGLDYVPVLVPVTTSPRLIQRSL